MVIKAIWGDLEQRELFVIVAAAGSAVMIWQKEGGGGDTHILLFAQSHA